MRGLAGLEERSTTGSEVYTLIAGVVDDFIERLLVHERPSMQIPPIRRARQRVPAQGSKFHVTTLV